jgi:predicted 3-demethylubiquinone-9 3-methyltransferase (glyoxalase superfamily)
MQKIMPHLWFDKEASQAAKFYTSIFPNSKILHSSVIRDTPSGDAENVSFELNGYTFAAISAGPYFKINPSISFFVNFDPSRDENAKENLNKLWAELSKGGEIRMPLQKYPFSEHYGWVQDKFGVNWQLMLTNPAGEERPFIVPSLMFTGEVSGKAKEAVNFYTSVFKPSKIGTIFPYAKGQEPDIEGTVAFADFSLVDQWFAAMDSARMHGFKFSEAISLMVRCKDQKEIDSLWEKLSAVPEAEQCGWLKDKFGLSWQIVPSRMDEMMSSGTPEQTRRVVKAFLSMKKFNISELEKAFKG